MWLTVGEDEHDDHHTWETAAADADDWIDRFRHKTVRDGEWPEEVEDVAVYVEVARAAEAPCGCGLCAPGEHVDYRLEEVPLDHRTLATQLILLAEAHPETVAACAGLAAWLREHP